MQEEARRLVSNLANIGSSAVKLGQLANICVTNALARAMIGRRVFNDISGGSDPKAEEFKSMVMEMMELGGVFNISDFIPALEWLDLQGVHSKMKKLHKRFDSFLTNIVEEHKVSKNHNNRDLLSTLLSLKEVHNDEGATLTNVEIKALLMVLYFCLRFICIFVKNELLLVLLSNGIIRYDNAELVCRRDGHDNKHNRVGHVGAD